MMTDVLSQNLEAAYVVAMLTGALLHWGRAYVHDPAATGSLMQYWLGGAPGDKGDSMCTALALVLAIVGGLAAGITDVAHPWLVVSGALTTGYSLDSFFNRGAAPDPPAPVGKATEAILAK